jgi:hypothetical protein
MGSNETAPQPGVELKSAGNKRNGSAQKMTDRCGGVLSKEGANERWAKFRYQQHGAGVTCDGKRK